MVFFGILLQIYSFWFNLFLIILVFSVFFNISPYRWTFQLLMRITMWKLNVILSWLNERNKHGEVGEWSKGRDDRKKALPLYLWHLINHQKTFVPNFSSLLKKLVYNETLMQRFEHWLWAFPPLMSWMFYAQWICYQWRHHIQSA